MKDTQLLDYLFSQNEIPVWLVRDDAFRYRSPLRPGLRPDSDLLALFAPAVAQAVDTPAFYMVEGTELLATVRVGDGSVLVAGPCTLLQPVDAGHVKHLLMDYLYEREAAQEAILFSRAVEIDAFLSFFELLLLWFGIEAYDAARLRGMLDYVSLRDVVGSDVTGRVYNIREQQLMSPYSYDSEQRLLACVQSGDVEAAAQAQHFYAPRNRGNIVPDDYKQFLYESIALITLVTRAAVAGGMDVDRAYMLSDQYIRRMDATGSIDALTAVARDAIVDFAAQVAENRDDARLRQNPLIWQSIQYIRRNLHYPLTLTDVAGHVGVTVKHLSRLFVAETGRRFCETVQQHRVEEAKNLLVFSNLSLLQISSTLCFSSQSYFTKVFCRHTGLTPRAYRTQHHRTQ